MPARIPGIHHVTAIASSPRRNFEFYTRVLGLRLVKKTVNFDDPYTYHLYYGDEVGHPGSILTFFLWPDTASGRVGTGQVTTTTFAIPEGSVDYWRDRLGDHGVETDDPIERFDDAVLALRDPDGLHLELAVHENAGEIEPWADGPVPAEHAIRGFHGVTLAVEAHEHTGDLLERMGFEAVARERQRYRYRSNGPVGSIVDVEARPNARPGYVSAGTVHHVAFRVADGSTQREWREELVDAGFDVTPVIDRQYFRSIYFREPGGVLFEIATEPPGFTVDEDAADLGIDLKLPPWLESRRDRIEADLPAIPGAQSGRNED